MRRSQRFEFECFTQDQDGNPIGEPELKFMNGSLVSKDKRFQVSKVGPSRIRLVASLGVQIDTKEVKMTCGVREKVAIITINIRNICQPNERYCKSGECISNDKFCDGVVNCPDGSDEEMAQCSKHPPLLMSF